MPWWRSAKHDWSTKKRRRELWSDGKLWPWFSIDREVQQLLPSWHDLEILESGHSGHFIPLPHLNSDLYLEHLSTSWGTGWHYASLKAKMGIYVSKNSQGMQDLLNITAFLDPRFRTQYISAMAEIQTIMEWVISELTMFSLHNTFWVILTSFTLAYDYFILSVKRMLYFKVGYSSEIHYYYRSWMEDGNLGMDNGERSNVCWAQHLHALCSPMNEINWNGGRDAKYIFHCCPK